MIVFSKLKKSENSKLYFNYYNTCKLITTKQAKMRKLQEEEARELEGRIREER